MNKKEFDKYVERDGACLHCGTTDETLVPNHRAGRGLGGSRSLDRASNVVVLCSLFNGLIESDSRAAARAIRMGWKLRRYEKPESVPVWDNNTSEWYFLNNDYTRTKIIDKLKLP